jgi:hypothetical protein
MTGSCGAMQMQRSELEITQMLTVEECRKLALARLKEINQRSNEELVLLDKVVEFDTTIAFSYQTAAFLESGNPVHALADNGPILVDRRNGRVEGAGTARPLVEYVRDFEARSV